jgi:nitroreductase
MAWQAATSAFLLALTARGLGSCVQVSVAGYPDTLREQLDIGADYRILCGVAIGYPDPDFAANSLNVQRNRSTSTSRSRRRED